MPATDSLQRFVDAQDPVFDQVMSELHAGRKTSHWIWFVFPQLKGLGRSSTAEHFGLADGTQARAYLAHERLGSRLVQAVEAMLQHTDKSALHILGSPDDLKFRSCLTLFAHVAPAPAVFEQALRQFYQGEPDPRTLALLSQASIS